MLWVVNDFETADEERERSEGCYKLLLDAGSDISSIKSEEMGKGLYRTSAYPEELTHGTLVSLIPLLPSIFKAAYHI